MSGNLYRLPIMIVALVIGIIMVTTVILPLSSEYSEAKTFTNEGYFYLNNILSDDTESHTISWTSTDSKILTVDGEDMDITSWGLSSYQQVTVFATETDLFRLGVGSANSGLSWIQIRGSTINYAQASSNFDATISAGAASILIDSDATPKELAYSSAYIIAPNGGDYVMKKSDEAAYMLKDSTFYNLGYTVISNGGGSDNTVLLVSGDMESATVQIVRQSTANEITFSDVDIVKSSVNGYEDLYRFDKITFTATENSTDNDVTYSYVIVPAEVTADPDNPAAYKSLVMVIPLMSFVVLVVAAAAMIYLKKD